MGWSCKTDAGDVLSRLMDTCYAQTGSTNVWEARGKRYMFETSCRSHDDGRITGKLWRFVTNESIVPAGTFCIKSANNYRLPATLRQMAGL